MQHDGWLETYLHSRFPTHELVFRNLGFSGDELTAPAALAVVRHPRPVAGRIGAGARAEPTGHSQRRAREPLRDDQHQADVVFAFFGYNESFAGEAGLDKFKKDLDTFIKHTLAQKYNGKSAPRLVLFSPIAHEDLKTPTCPTARRTTSASNCTRRRWPRSPRPTASPSWTCSIRRATSTPRPSQPLTINGIHLNEQGNEAVAEIIDQALFGGDRTEARRQSAGEAPPGRPGQELLLVQPLSHHGRLQRLRRPGLRDAITDQQSNYEDQQREMEVLDVMTANRDKRIWAVAQGKRPQGRRQQHAAVHPRRRPTSPAPGRTASIIFLDGEEAIKKMTVAKGMKVNAVRLREGVSRAGQAGADGVRRARAGCGWPSGRAIRTGSPKEEMNDKILIFEDTKGDRQGRQVHRLRRPPELSDRLRVLQRRRPRRPGAGPDLPQGHQGRRQGRPARARAARPGLGRHAPHRQQLRRSIRAARSTSRKARSITRRSRRPTARRCAAPMPASIRYEPRTQKFDVYVTYGFANPHGHVFDRWGQDIVVDGTGANPYHGALFSGHLDYPQKHAHPPQVYKQRTAALPRRRNPVQPALPRGEPGQSAGAPTSSASRASCSTSSRTRAPASPAPRSSRSSPPPIRTSARRT